MIPPGRFAKVFDTSLLASAVALAVLVSSFVALNSDVWQHLALGRIIASGQYDFGSDPLGYSTEGLRWANHGWLTDWAAYQSFELGGGAALVGIKAHFVAAIVGIGITGLRREQAGWLAALFLALAIVVFSARATLQPMIVSCLLFAMTLRLLQLGGKAYRFIPAIAVLWVNLDGWFVLAPSAVGLHWLADRWNSPKRVPAWLPLATLGACLISPYHIRASTLPAELNPALLWSQIIRDPRVAVQFASYFAKPGEHLDNASFWAFCALILGGTALVIARRRHVRLWELSLWFIGVALGAWQIRLVPLCAVVAIVLLTPHVQAVTPGRGWGRLGRGVALVALLACGLAAWSGWLHGGRARDHVLGWDVYADPSVVRAGETLTEWRRNGELSAEDRVLVTSPEAANTLYWFASGERGDIDTRWDLHARAGRSYPLNNPEEIDAERFALVLLYDPTPATLATLLDEKSAWRIHRIDGRAVWLKRRAQAAPASDPRRFAYADGPETPRPTRWPRGRAWWQPPVILRLDRSADAATAPTQLNLQIASKATDPALPLMAVRSARRAIAADPDDGQAWLALAKAYAVLGATAENRVASGSGLLNELRRVQRITALTLATVANPESEGAREGLAATLTEVGYLDRALVERRRQKTLLQRRGDADRLADVTPLVAKLEDEVFDRECSYHVRTAKLSGDPLARARIALGLGLVDLARDTLLKASSDLYGVEGVKLLAGLLVGTGQAAEAETLLNREELVKNPDRLGYHEVPSLTGTGVRIVYRLPAYDWFQFLLAASAGLGDARIPLDRLRDYFAAKLGGVAGHLDFIALPVSIQIAAEIGVGASRSFLPRIVIDGQREQLTGAIAQSRYLIVERADLTALDGWCALEAGRTAEALAQFRAALADYAGVADLRAAPAKEFAEMYRKEIEAARR